MNLGGSLMDISDTPLKFKQILIERMFMTTEQLVGKLAQSYFQQGIMQFYKILGSIDLIGNPVSFIDTVGKG
jgi:vacuolar protein sorting-associated protein 13A/C